MPDTMAPLEQRAIRVTPVSDLTRTLLRGDPGALGGALGLILPTVPCTSQAGDPAALWLGPDEWLLLSSQPAAALGDDVEGAAAFDVSHRQLAWTVEGPRAAEVLQAACPLDLESLPIGACTRTVFGKAEIVLWRREAGLFHLEVWRSFAPYVSALLETAIAALPRD